MKDQLFKFSKLIFVTCIVLAILVGLLIAFIALGGNARFHLIKTDGKTIEAEVNRKSAQPDSVSSDTTSGHYHKSEF